MYHGRMIGLREARERFPEIEAEAWSAADSAFPVRVTRSFFERIRRSDDPLGLQVLPGRDELVPDAGDVPDPVGEAGLRPVPWVVRKHEDRALLLVTRRCHLTCRYCFRRDQDGPEDPAPEELEAALRYLCSAGLEEVILSGGDPLAVSDRKLVAILERLRPHVRLLRIHTRAPVTAPHRVTPALAAALAALQPLRVVIHANHARELVPDVEKAVRLLLDGGISVLNQSVLLRGVNDDPDALADLCGALVRLGVRPYYLHHPDAVPGAARFRVGLEEGLAIHAELERRLPASDLPRYVVDPPDGSGKVLVRDYVGAES
jgi:lysine 2,3-aminomutase